MARIEIDPNYSGPTFSRATAGADLFKKEDVQSLAAAVSGHTHVPGKGLAILQAALPASLNQSGSITAASGVINGTFSVGTTSTFGGVATFSSSVTINGVVTLNNNVNVAGTLTASAITSNGNASVAGSLTTANLTVSGSSAITGQETVGGNMGVGVGAPVCRLDVLNGYFRIGGTTNAPPTSGFGVEIFADLTSGYGAIACITRSGGAIASRSPLAVSGDVTLGSGAPAVGATTGFPRLPLMAGPPTGAPDQTGILSGHRSIVIEDSGTPKIWVRLGVGWKSAALV